MPYGRSRDPYWLIAKYPGKAQDGTPFKKGDRVFYFPATKAILVGEEAEKAARKFDVEKSDEDLYNSSPSGYMRYADDSVQAGDLDDACWEDYEAVGLKPGAGGKMVPNCVPVKSAAWKVEAKRTTHLEGKSGYTACGERAHDDTLVESVKDATCHYCKQAWEKQH